MRNSSSDAALRWRGRSLGAFDAVLAACAARAGATALVSADMAFAAVPEITHVVPDEAGPSRLPNA